jgi:hypothetical protein
MIITFTLIGDLTTVGTGIIGMYSLTTANLVMIGGGLLFIIGHLLDRRLNQKQDQEQE